MVAILSLCCRANPTRSGSAVLAHDLADDARGREAGEPCQVDGAFGLPRAHQHAAAPRAQREDVPGRDDVVRAGVGGDGGADRRRAVDGRDAATDAEPGVDRDRERGAERRPVLRHHHREPELVAAALREREADQPAAVRRHEVDLLGGHPVGGDAEIALVLAVLVVHEDDHAAGADLLQRLLDRDDGPGLGGCHRGG